MKCLVFLLIGIVSQYILKSAGVTPLMWQFYGIAGCLVATIIASAILLR